MIEEWRSPEARKIVQAARSFVGTPFAHQGREPGKALDCIGIALSAAKLRGFDLPDWPLYQSSSPSGTRLVEYVRLSCEEVPLEEARWGDIALMFWRKHDLPQHLLMLTDRGILHANNVLGKVVEETMRWSVSTRLHSAYYFRGAA